MKPRRTTYQNKHRIRPKNRYSKPIRKPKEIPEVEEGIEEYEDPRDDTPTLNQFLEGIGMKKKEESEFEELRVSVNKLKETLRLLRQSQSESQGIVLNMAVMCVKALRDDNPDERERVANSLQGWLDNIQGTNETRN